MKYIKEYGPYILIIVVVLLLKTYVITPIIVSGDSMYSTLHDGDIMILNKLYDEKDIKRYDIVVVKYKEVNSSGKTSNKDIIKRIIGMPGDKVECIDNVLYINGEKVEEDYLDKDTITENFSLNDLYDTDTVPEGMYFVLGDNREVSLDSRRIGFIDIDDIEGKASFTLFPFNRFGKKE